MQDIFLVKMKLYITFLVLISYCYFSLSRKIKSQGCYFTKVQGYSLHGNDDLIIHAIPLETCKDICLNYMECLSFDYNLGSTCYLSKHSRSTKPLDFVRNLQQDYYQKFCQLDSGVAGEMKCPGGYFTCLALSYTCIPDEWRCDNYADCNDESDEIGCFGDDTIADGDDNDDEDETVVETTTTAFHQPEPNVNCNEMTHFACKTSVNPSCIPRFFVCDNHADCKDGSDEINCSAANCSTYQFVCRRDGTCLFQSWVCDGDPDCKDASDEWNCSRANCSSHYQFTCEQSGICIPQMWVCDHEIDCADGSDERWCKYS